MSRKQLLDVKDAILKPVAEIAVAKPSVHAKVVEKSKPPAKKSNNESCRLFEAGSCRYGDKCKYPHSATKAKPGAAKAKSVIKNAKNAKHPQICMMTRKGATCRFGEKCLFRHCSTPPSKGDEKAIALGASASKPENITFEKATFVEPSPKFPAVAIAKKVVVCPSVAGNGEEWALDTVAASDVANRDVVGKRRSLGPPPPHTHTHTHSCMVCRWHR